MVEVALKADLDIGEGAKSLKSLKQEFKETQKELDGLTVGSEKYVQTLKKLGAIKDDGEGGGDSGGEGDGEDEDRGSRGPALEVRRPTSAGRLGSGHGGHRGLECVDRLAPHQPANARSRHALRPSYRQRNEADPHADAEGGVEREGTGAPLCAAVSAGHWLC